MRLFHGKIRYMKAAKASLDSPKCDSIEGYMLKAALTPISSLEEDAWSVEKAAAHAIARAGSPTCEFTKGWWIYDRQRGIAIPRSCKKWQCHSCRHMKRLAVLLALQHGLAAFHAAGHEVHALTLTDGDGKLDFAAFHEAWGNRLRPWLRRNGFLHAYASALEVQPQSGRLHCHVLIVAPLGKSGFVPHDRLTAACRRAGLGFAFIQHVSDIPAASDALMPYLVKEPDGAEEVAPTGQGGAAPYVAKDKDIDALAALAGHRLRPFRVSRNWPLNLTNAAKKLREELYGEPADGAWQVVHESRVARWLDPLRAQQRRERERERKWAVASRYSRIAAMQEDG